MHDSEGFVELGIKRILVEGEVLPFDNQVDPAASGFGAVLTGLGFDLGFSRNTGSSGFGVILADFGFDLSC